MSILNNEFKQQRILEMSESIINITGIQMNNNKFEESYVLSLENNNVIYIQGIRV